METTLPAGLVDSNLEFFVNENKVSALQNGMVKPFSNLTSDIKEIIITDMLNNKKATDKLQSWGLTGDALIEKYMMCRCGGFDNVPDVDLQAKKINVEYLSCPKRMMCDGSGVVCVLPEGLSHRHIDVIKSVKEGLPAKLACDKIGMEYHAYRASLKRLYSKLHVHSNTELLKVANELNIL